MTVAQTATVTALRAHVFVRSLSASLNATGAIFDGAVSIAQPLVASHAHTVMYAVWSGDTVWPAVAVMVMCLSRT